MKSSPIARPPSVHPARLEPTESPTGTPTPLRTRRLFGAVPHGDGARVLALEQRAVIAARARNSRVRARSGASCSPSDRRPLRVFALIEAVALGAGHDLHPRLATARSSSLPRSSPDRATQLERDVRSPPGPPGFIGRARSGARPPPSDVVAFEGTTSEAVPTCRLTGGCKALDRRECAVSNASVASLRFAHARVSIALSCWRARHRARVWARARDLDARCSSGIGD